MTRILERILLGIIVLTFCIAIYLSYAENLPFRETLLISLMLLTAGEPLSLNPHTIQWFTGFLVVIQSLMGLATLTITLALLTNFLFSERVQKMLAKEKITMKDHVILCGLGNVGYKVLKELLRLKQEVVVVDWGDDKNLLERSQSKGVKILSENLKNEKTLDEANINEAKSLIICTGHDLLNMEVALNARERRPEIPIVMRMFDSKLASKISHAFNIRIAFSSAHLAAPVFAAAAIDRSVFGSLQVGKQVFISVKKLITPNSQIDGLTVGALLENRELSVLKLISGDDHLKFPPRDRKIKGGDTLYITCTQEALGILKEMNHSNADGQPLG